MLFLVFYSAIGSVFFEYALDATFAAVTNAPQNMAPDMPIPHTEDEWLENIEKSEETITSGGYNLKATLIMNEVATNRYIISIHGYRGKSTEMSFYAKKFYEAGYNVLLPDLKGHGKSEGQYIGMGYFDRLDILGWIDFLVEKDSTAIIALHGISMGASTVISVSGEETKDNVVCLVEDCGFTNAYKEFDHVAKNVLKLPAANVILNSSDLISKVRLGVSLKDIAPIAQLKKATKPMLFIHGTADNFVPFYMLDELYEANENIEKQKLIIEGANHAYSATYNPDLYFKTVIDFINSHMEKSDV